MGYTTEFNGEFVLDGPLCEEAVRKMESLKGRRMKRDMNVVAKD